MPFSRVAKLFSSPPPDAPRVPAGRRVYAVGDIHGRLDLLEQLLGLIEQDDAARGEADTLLIFLGDLVDRGPNSRGVVERLLRLSRERGGVEFVMGNHDQVFLEAASGSAGATRYMVRIGGRPTIASYGITEREYAEADFDQLTRMLAARVPREHLDFLASFKPSVELGDYVFVHAGVRPGVPLGEQDAQDLCWIRDEFLHHRSSFEKMVVHGHSISEAVEMRPNRIGIDTGAYATGKLTALGLESDRRWLLST